MPPKNKGKAQNKKGASKKPSASRGRSKSKNGGKKGASVKRGKADSISVSVRSSSQGSDSDNQNQRRFKAGNYVALKEPELPSGFIVIQLTKDLYQNDDTVTGNLMKPQDNNMKILSQSTTSRKPVERDASSILTEVTVKKKKGKLEITTADHNSI